jgi:hypothetical protein
MRREGVLMRLNSFTTIAIRLIGLMSIFYGILTIIFMALTFLMFSGFGAEGRFPGMGSMLLIQFLLPGLMILFGGILISASRSLADSISRGLED